MGLIMVDVVEIVRPLRAIGTPQAPDPCGSRDSKAACGFVPEMTESRRHVTPKHSQKDPRLRSALTLVVSLAEKVLRNPKRLSCAKRGGKV